MEKTILEGRISTVTFIIRLVIDCLWMFLLVGFIFIIRDIIRFITTKITITDRRITGRMGLIKVYQIDSPLNKVQAVEVHQGLFGQIFNYGDIRISTASNSTPITFHYIDKPNDFRTTLNNQIEEYDNARIEKQAEKLAAAVKK